MTDIDPEVKAPARRGWPKGKPRPKKVAPVKETPQSATPTKPAPKKVPGQSMDSFKERYGRFGGGKPMGRTPAGRIEWSDDKFYIDPDRIPPGWSVEWRVQTVMGQEMRQEMARTVMDGWEPVDGAVFPEFGFAAGEIIEIGGLVCMWRPLEMTQEAHEYREKEAKNQVRTQLHALEDTPSGDLPRAGKGTRAEGDPRLFSVKRGEPVPVRGDTKYEYD